MGSLLNSRIEIRQLLQNAIRRGISPGFAAGLAAVGGDIRRVSFAAGTLCSDRKFKVSLDSQYDLASLTKLMSTTILTAVAVERGIVSLQEEPWLGWPGVTISHVLSHTAGLPAYEEFYTRLGMQTQPSAVSKKLVIKSVLASPLVANPGAMRLYSDLGFIALGHLLEQRFGANLDRLFSDIVGKMLPIRDICYRPLDRHAKADNIAPTTPGFFSKSVKIGTVQDDNCYATNGVAGHAGLFGSLNAVLGFGISLTQNLLTARKGAFRILKDFSLSRPYPLGFDIASPNGSTGNALHIGSVGHLGFTGTSLWLELDYAHRTGSVFVLLSNRVHTSASTKQILELRREFHRNGARIARELMRSNL